MYLLSIYITSAHLSVWYNLWVIFLNFFSHVLTTKYYCYIFFFFSCLDVSRTHGFPIGCVFSGRVIYSNQTFHGWPPHETSRWLSLCAYFLSMLSPLHQFWSSRISVCVPQISISFFDYCNFSIFLLALFSYQSIQLLYSFWQTYPNSLLFQVKLLCLFPLSINKSIVSIWIIIFICVV